MVLQLLVVFVQCVRFYR